MLRVSWSSSRRPRSHPRWMRGQVARRSRRSRTAPPACGRSGASGWSRRSSSTAARSDQERCPPLRAVLGPTVRRAIRPVPGDRSRAAASHSSATHPVRRSDRAPAERVLDDLFELSRCGRWRSMTGLCAARGSAIGTFVQAQLTSIPQVQPRLRLPPALWKCVKVAGSPRGLGDPATAPGQALWTITRAQPRR